MIDIRAAFEKLDGAFLKFDDISDDQRPSKRPDLCAFIRLDKLMPSDRDMISASEHDEYFLEVDLDELAAVASEDDVLYLVRCGVRLTEFDCLGLFA